MAVEIIGDAIPEIGKFVHGQKSAPTADGKSAIHEIAMSGIAAIRITMTMSHSRLYESISRPSDNPLQNIPDFASASGARVDGRPFCSRDFKVNKFADHRDGSLSNVFSIFTLGEILMTIAFKGLNDGNGAVLAVAGTLLSADNVELSAERFTQFDVGDASVPNPSKPTFQCLRARAPSRWWRR